MSNHGEEKISNRLVSVHFRSIPVTGNLEDAYTGPAICGKCRSGESVSLKRPTVKWIGIDTPLIFYGCKLRVRIFGCECLIRRSGNV